MRELENLLERTAVVAAGPRIDADDLPQECTASGAAQGSRSVCFAPVATDAAPPSQEILCKAPADLVEALRQAGGNVRVAARTLGVSRVTLYARIRRSGLDLAAMRRQHRGP